MKKWKKGQTRKKGKKDKKEENTGKETQGDENILCEYQRNKIKDGKFKRNN